MYPLKNFANFSRTIKRYDIKFYTLVTHSIFRKFGKFRYIIYRIDIIMLLLVMETLQLRRYQKLSQLFETAQTP